MALQLPHLYDLEGIALIYPTDYYESMNTVLVQEAERYNRLLDVMHVSLKVLTHSPNRLLTHLTTYSLTYSLKGLATGVERACCAVGRARSHGKCLL